VPGAIAALLAKSLMQQEVGAAGGPRFTLLEVIGEYAWERLEEWGEARALRRWHAEYYLALAEGAASQLSGATQKEWLDRLEREHANLRAALDRGLAQGEVERAGRLSVALWPFWWMHGHLREGRGWLARVLAAGAALPPPVRAQVLGAADELASRQGDYGPARAFSEESLTLWRDLGDREGMAAALNNLSAVAGEQGDYATARAAGEESRALMLALGDQRGLAAVLSNLGMWRETRKIMARPGPCTRRAWPCGGISEIRRAW
jgi:tetratricopeptide repeat protein